MLLDDIKTVKQLTNYKQFQAPLPHLWETSEMVRETQNSLKKG